MWVQGNNNLLLLVKYGLASYQKHRIVAYSAYIFKALGVQFQSPRDNSSTGLCRMHPGNYVLVNREPLGRTSGCIIAEVRAVTNF